MKWSSKIRVDLGRSTVGMTGTGEGQTQEMIIETTKSLNPRGRAHQVMNMISITQKGHTAKTGGKKSTNQKAGMMITETSQIKELTRDQSILIATVGVHTAMIGTKVGVQPKEKIDRFGKKIITVTRGEKKPDIRGGHHLVLMNVTTNLESVSMRALQLLNKA
jgi:hypothetical protein